MDCVEVDVEVIDLRDVDGAGNVQMRWLNLPHITLTLMGMPAYQKWGCPLLIPKHKRVERRMERCGARDAWKRALAKGHGYDLNSPRQLRA